MTPNEKRKATLAKNREAALTNGKRLRQRRIEAGLTQQRAATAAGVTVDYWQVWEVGTRAYPARRLPAIAAALGIPIASLLVDDVVLAEIRVSPETLERVKREGRPAALAAAERLAAGVAELLIAEATKPARDLGPYARAKPRRSREQKLADQQAAFATASARSAAIAEERRRSRRVA